MRECYLCHSKKFKIRNKRTRDRADLKVLECPRCSLVFLDNFNHLKDFSYTDSQNNYEKKIKTVRDYQALLKDLRLDDERRIKQWEKILKNKIVLDFGSGAGGFLQLALPLAKKVYGVELDKITRFYKNKIVVYKQLKDFKIKFEVITLFHVLEHIADPIGLLKEIKKYLAPGGKIIIEVPNDNDALISYYQLPAFKDFTYWSLHLYSYNRKTLTEICRRAGFKQAEVNNWQRYSLANHLGWLKNGKPGGDNIFPELRADKNLNEDYARRLKKMSICDTLIAVLG